MHYFKYYLNCFIGFVEIPIDDEAADDASGQGPTAPTAPPTAATASLRALSRRWPLWNPRRAVEERRWNPRRGSDRTTHQQLHPDSRRGGPDSRRGGPDSRRGGPDSRRGARGGPDPRRSPPAIKHELATDSAPQRLVPRPPTPPPAYVEFEVPRPRVPQPGTTAAQHRETPQEVAPQEVAPQEVATATLVPVAVQLSRVPPEEAVPAGVPAITSAQLRDAIAAAATERARINQVAPTAPNSRSESSNDAATSMAQELQQHQVAAPTAIISQTDDADDAVLDEKDSAEDEEVPVMPKTKSTRQGSRQRASTASTLNEQKIKAQAGAAAALKEGMPMLYLPVSYTHLTLPTIYSV